MLKQLVIKFKNDNFKKSITHISSGGGTDLSSYYKINGGRFIAAAIDKHVYITIAETFNKIYS